jgi:phage terminase large subunit
MAALEEAGLLSQCTVNKSDFAIELPNGSGFWFVGADDTQKLKSIEGVTDYWLEELPEFAEEDLDTIDAGLSADVEPQCQIFLTFNPVPIIENYLPWMARRFIVPIEHELGVLATKDNIALLKTWYRHNAFCPKATRDLLDGYKDKNPELYQLWALGNFTRIEGAVFKNWDVVGYVPDNVEDLGVGVDYGFANDPAAVLRVYMRENEVWLKGLVYSTDLSNPALFDKMRAAGVAWNDMITPDSAEPKSNEDMRKYGFRCVRPVKKRSGYKEDLVRRIHGFKIHLIAGDEDLQREIATYAYAKDKEGKVLPKLQDGNDHYVDAFIMRVHDYYQYRDIKIGNVGAADLGL